MASKAYVVAMTVSELKEELKQRGMSTKGSKKDLRDRLEQALYDEELDDPSSESESESGGHTFSQGVGTMSGFNFVVPPESFIAEEDLLPDDEDEEDEDYAEPMTVSIELSNKERLEVCPRASATARMAIGIGDRSMGDRGLNPMIVQIEIGNRQLMQQGSGVGGISRGVADGESAHMDASTVEEHSGIVRKADAISRLSASMGINGGREPPVATLHAASAARETTFEACYDHPEPTVTDQQSRNTSDHDLEVTQTDGIQLVQQIHTTETTIDTEFEPSSRLKNDENISKSEITVSDDRPLESPKVSPIESSPTEFKSSLQTESPAETIAEKIEETHLHVTHTQNEPHSTENIHPPAPIDVVTSTVVETPCNISTSPPPVEQQIDQPVVTEPVSESILPEDDNLERIQSPEPPEQEIHPGIPTVNERETSKEPAPDTVSMEDAQTVEPPPLSEVTELQEEVAKAGGDMSTDEMEVQTGEGESLSVEGDDKEQYLSANVGVPEQGIASKMKDKDDRIDSMEVEDSSEGLPAPSEQLETDSEGMKPCSEVVESIDTEKDSISVQQVPLLQDTVLSTAMEHETSAVQEAVDVQEQTHESVTNVEEPTSTQLNQDQDPGVTHTTTESEVLERNKLSEQNIEEPLTLEVVKESNEVTQTLAKQEAVEDIQESGVLSECATAILLPEPLKDDHIHESEQSPNNPDQDVSDNQSPPQSLGLLANCATRQEELSAPERPPDIVEDDDMMEVSTTENQTTSPPQDQTISEHPTEHEAEQPHDVDMVQSATLDAQDENTLEQPPDVQSELMPVEKSPAFESEQPPKHLPPAESEQPLAVESESMHVVEVDKSPVFESEQPSVEAEQLPTAELEQPLAVESEQPSVESEQPSVELEQLPTAESEQPSVQSEQLSTADSEGLGVESEQPGVESEQPDIDLEQPSIEPEPLVPTETEQPHESNQSLLPAHTHVEKSPIPEQDVHVAEETLTHDQDISPAETTEPLPVQDTTETIPVNSQDQHIDQGKHNDQEKHDNQDVTESTEAPSSDHNISLPLQEEQVTSATSPPIQKNQESAPEQTVSDETTTVQEELVAAELHKQDVVMREQGGEETGPLEPPQQQQMELEQNTPIKEVVDTPADTVPSSKEMEQVSQTTLQIDDVLVHAEEDDLSVFSTEAAEADLVLTNLNSSNQSQQQHSSGRSSHSVVVHEQVGRARKGSSESSRLVSSSSNEKRSRQEKEEDHTETPSVKRRRISTHGPGSSTSSATNNTQERKRRWGSAKQRSNSASTPTATISSDVLKDIIPADMEGIVVDEGDDMTGEEGFGNEGEEEQVTRNEELATENSGGTGSAADLEWQEVEKERELKRREVERARQELETRKRIEARLRAKQEADAKAQRESADKDKKRTPSPARNAKTRILHVENLTRPFTKMQLIELLTEDGPIIEDAYWTNRVKSHCIVVYKNEGTAVTTRERLHGIKWPSTNPKRLNVDFLTADRVAVITEGQLVVDEIAEGEEEVQEVQTEEEEMMVTVKQEVIESKDEDMAVPSQSLEGQAVDNNEVKVNDKSDDGAVQAEQPVPDGPKKGTKVLDELFKKTKATPSIYWLPLTDAQVAEREAEERAREEERERQREERIRLRREEREKEDKERERRLQAERERRARERMRRHRSRSKSCSPSRSRNRSRSRSRDRGRRR